MDSASNAGFAVGQLIGVVIAAVIGIFVGKDASERGMNGWLWGIFTFLLCIIALPVYLIVRKPKVGGGY
jgi:MFS family permease